MQWSIERVVTILSPLFVALSGAITTGVAQLIPGVTIPNADITALFVSGATLGGAALLKWLHGRQKFVQFESDTDKVVARLEGVVRANQPASVALGDIEGILRSHTDQIVQAVGNAVHAPPSAQEVAEQIITAAAQTQHPSTPPPAI